MITLKWLNICKKYGIQDSAGGLQFSPKGLRNRVFKRIANRKKNEVGHAVNMTDVIFSITAEQLEAELTGLEFAFFNWYWGGVDKALLHFKQTSQQIKNNICAERELSLEIRDAIMRRCNALKFDDSIFKPLCSLATILTYDYEICLNQKEGVPDSPTLKPESNEIWRAHHEGKLLAYLLQVPLEVLRLYWTPRGLRIFWTRKISPQDSESEALDILQCELENKPIDDLLIQIYYGDKTAFVRSLTQRTDQAISSRLGTQDGFLNYLAEQCRDWDEWPSSTEFKECWNPGDNHPSASHIIGIASIHKIAWHEIGRNLDLPFGDGVRKRYTKDETVEHYLKFKPKAGRFPSTTDLRGLNPKLTSNIFFHFGTMNAFYKELGIPLRRSIECRDGTFVQSPAEKDLYHLLLDEIKGSSWLFSIETQVGFKENNYTVDFLLNDVLYVEMEMVDSSKEYVNNVKRDYAETNREKLRVLRGMGIYIITLQQEDRYKSNQKQTLNYLRECINNVGNKIMRPDASSSVQVNKHIGYWTKEQIFKALQTSVQDFENKKSEKPKRFKELFEFSEIGFKDAFRKYLTDREQNNYLKRLGVTVQGRMGITYEGSNMMIHRSFLLGLLLMLRHMHGIVVTSNKAKVLGFVDSRNISATIAKSFKISMREFAFSCDLWFYNSGGTLDKPAKQRSCPKSQLSEMCAAMPRFSFSQWKHVKEILTEGKFCSAKNAWHDGGGFLFPETVAELEKLFIKTDGQIPSGEEWKKAGLTSFLRVDIKPKKAALPVQNSS